MSPQFPRITRGARPTPIHPGEQFTLELMIWDAGDGILDSSVLLDHFQWLGVSTPTPITQPVAQ